MVLRLLFGVMMVTMVSSKISQVVTCSGPQHAGTLYVLIGTHEALVTVPNAAVNIGSSTGTRLTSEFNASYTARSTTATQWTLTQTQAELVAITNGKIAADSICTAWGPYAAETPPPAVSPMGLWAAPLAPDAASDCYTTGTSYPMLGWYLAEFPNVASSVYELWIDHTAEEGLKPAAALDTTDRPCQVGVAGSQGSEPVKAALYGVTVVQTGTACSSNVPSFPFAVAPSIDCNGTSSPKPSGFFCPVQCRGGYTAVGQVQCQSDGESVAPVLCAPPAGSALFHTVSLLLPPL